MSSLKDSIALLESDLIAEPPRINVYRDLPFAIMRYDPIHNTAQDLVTGAAGAALGFSEGEIVLFLAFEEPA